MPIVLRSNWCALVAAALAVLMFWGWGTGPDGDLAFAAPVTAFAAACFASGRLLNRWWLVAALPVVWAVGWFFGGGAADPDGYTWAVAFLAPLIAVFLALGTGSRRARPRLPV